MVLRQTLYVLFGPRGGKPSKDSARDLLQQASTRCTKHQILNELEKSFVEVKNPQRKMDSL
jgi:hypothetical protein